MPDFHRPNVMSDPEDRERGESDSFPPRRSMGSHSLPNKGATDVWLTPPTIVNALGPFDLDPCAAEGQPWQTAENQWTCCGLDYPWSGFVWCNPPFSNAQTWLNRLAEHGNGIGLCAARTETRWFVNAVWGNADSILFLHGRPYFHKPDGTKGNANSGVPICLIGYGSLAEDRLLASGLAGSLVTSWKDVT